MFCCVTASITGALVCLANVEFGVQVAFQVVVACPETKHSCLLLSVYQVVGINPVVAWVLVHSLAVLLGFEDDGLHLSVAGRPIYFFFFVPSW